MVFCLSHTKDQNWSFINEATLVFNTMPLKHFEMYMSVATNPAFAQLPSKSPFSPQMTWKLVHSCEKKRRKWQDQRQTYNVWTRLTCLYALPEVWENGDAGPSNGRKSRIFTPLEVMLSDTQRRQCRIFFKKWPHSILLCWKGAKKFWFSWKHNQEISEWAAWEEKSTYVSKIPVCNS